MLIVALNDLDVMAWDIGNTYIYETCKENILFKSVAECGDHLGTVVILVRYIYGLTTSGVSWRSMFFE